MRWFWIDRFVALHSGRTAEAIKAVTAAEPAVEEYMPGYPVFPPSLMIEGIAQTGGLLVSEIAEFRHRVVLAKIGRAEFVRHVTPGCCLHYAVRISDINDDGAAIEGDISMSYLDQRFDVAHIEMMFAYLKDNVAGLPSNMFPPDELMVMLRLFEFFEVARDDQGRPRPIPTWLVKAEERAIRAYQAESDGLPRRGPQ